MADVLPSILIVDDEPELCEIIAETLQGSFECTFCFDPPSVLELIEENDYDLILTDIQMPKVGAADLLRALKKLHKDVPVVLMSGNNRADPIVQKALDLGAAEVVPKPLPSQADLIALLLKHRKK